MIQYPRFGVLGQVATRSVWRGSRVPHALAALLFVGGSVFAGCDGQGAGAARQASPAARWLPFLHVPGVVDLTGPRSDGSLAVAAAGRLSLFTPDKGPRPFARGAGGYSTAPGPEPYIAVVADQTLPDAGCSFHQDDLYALEPSSAPGVVNIDALGGARRIADLPGGMLPDGIAYDQIGGFGHRLLVTATSQDGTTLFAIDCRGAVSTIARHLPTAEGGIAIAPITFGTHAGDLIAPDEKTGRIVSIDPRGKAVTLVESHLPAGGDIGVESAGFVPAGFGQASAAYLADRRSAGNPHPGTDSILRLLGAQLIQAGVRPGDLLVASEGAAKTIAVRCDAACTVRQIADGPAQSHVEGHIVWTALTS
jgi:hypothetical protein